MTTLKYKIIADSCQDLITEDCTYIPFTVSIEGKEFVDDENIDLKKLVQTMIDSDEAIQSACPSPGDYLQAMEESYEDHEGIFVITLSSKLSGSFNSAKLAKSMFLEDHPDYPVAVFDSRSAAAGETLVYLELKKLIEKELPFNEIKEEMEEFISNMETLFTLESIDNLVKNGRMSRPTAAVANVLSIKPVVKAVDGEIGIETIARGVRNSLRKLVDTIGKKVSNTKDKTLVITHVFAQDKAEYVKELAEKAYDFKEYVIVQGRGLSIGYADDKGIIIAFDGR